MNDFNQWLEKLASDVKQMTVDFLPYSTNKPSDAVSIIHREFYLSLVRARNPIHHPIMNQLRKQFKLWHLDLSNLQFEENKKIKNPAPYYAKEAMTLAEIKKFYENELWKRSDKVNHKDGTKMEPLEVEEGYAKNAIKYGIGNCGEMASLAFVLLLEQPPIRPDEKTTVEYLNFNGSYDHEFILLNRHPDSHLQDVLTWENAIVIDPWMNEVISVADQTKHPQASKAWPLLVTYQNHLHVVLSGCVGDGHSKRWIKKRQQKNESIQLGFWKRYEHHARLENTPWAEPSSAPCHTPKIF